MERIYFNFGKLGTALEKYGLGKFENKLEHLSGGNPMCEARIQKNLFNT